MKVFNAPTVEKANHFVRIYNDISLNKPLKSIVIGYKMVVDMDKETYSSFIRTTECYEWMLRKKDEKLNLEDLSYEVSLNNLIEIP